MIGRYKMGFTGPEARAVTDAIAAANAYYASEYRVISQSHIRSSIRQVNGTRMVVLVFEYRSMTPEEIAAQPPREPPPHRPTIEETLANILARLTALEQA